MVCDKKHYRKCQNRKLILNSPAGNYTGSIAVSGWAISHFGVKRVDIYVDGKGMASVQVSAFTTRTDIERIFGNEGYNNLAQSGFSYVIPSENLAGGAHTVKVAEIDNKGNVLWSAVKKFNVAASNPQICLDSPKGTYSGNISVSGWAISHFGVKRVDIYVDGKGLVSVPIRVFTERTDIERIFGNQGYYDLAQSGFTYTIPQGKLGAGTHTIKAAEINNDGHVLWSSQNSFQVTS